MYANMKGPSKKPCVNCSLPLINCQSVLCLTSFKLLLAFPPLHLYHLRRAAVPNATSTQMLVVVVHTMLWFWTNNKHQSQPQQQQQ